MDDSKKTDAPAITQSTAKCIPLRLVSLGILVTVVLYVGMALLADWQAFVASVSALPGVLWVQAVALSILSYLLRFARWHHFIAALGHKVAIHRNLEIYLAAFALTLTPGKVGETIRSVYLYPYGISYAQSIGAFVSERLLDLVAVGALASLAVSMFPEQRTWMIVALPCILLVVLLVRTRLISLIAKRLSSGVGIDQMDKVGTTIRFLLSSRRLVLASPLSLLAWTAQGVSLYLIVDALGYDLPIGTVVPIYCLSVLAGSASFIPGGLGATEGAIVLLLSAAGLTTTDAFTASILGRGLTLWLAIGVGLVAMGKIGIIGSLHKQ
jgi:uncharacterized membrane protein YbhN (UPF0104 family)